jgi:hypothetical protein
MALQESVAKSSEVGDNEGITTSLVNLGHANLLNGSIASAEQFYREAINVGRRIGYFEPTNAAVEGLAAAAARRGDRERARTLLSAAAASREHRGVKLWVVEADIHAQTVAAVGPPTADPMNWQDAIEYAVTPVD